MSRFVPFVAFALTLTLSLMAGAQSTLERELETLREMGAGDAAISRQHDVDDLLEEIARVAPREVDAEEGLLRLYVGTRITPEFLQEASAGTPAIVEAAPEEDEGPWRLDKELRAAGAPDWLSISGSVRLRYEGLDGQFRSAGRLDDQDHVFVIRSLLKISLDFDPVVIAFEGQDSRAYGANFGTAVGTSSVNAAELLQAYVLVRLGKLGSGEHFIRGGRQTFDLGSRRLVARNRFRNTINAFTGLLWEWKSDVHKMTAFYTLPVRRAPSDLGSLVDNDIEFDKEGFEFQFFGLHYERDVFERHTFDVYAFGLLESLKGSRDRDIYTIGGRFILPKKVAHLDYQIETAIQIGNSRLTSTGQRLDHFAGFVHASIGYTFDAMWKPRVRVALDFASGDDDPGDGENNRFETLFGARRFEYGPTGFYGAIARFNLLSPDLRLELKPRSDMSLMFAYRVFMLASKNDAWTAARVRDITGRSGRFVGQQIETRWRWELIPKVVRLEMGIAYLIGGEFQEDAPGGQDTDTVYGYIQTAFTF